ncbi:hypothetical protein ACV6DN_01710 [Enterobacter asburiae]
MRYNIQLSIQEVHIEWVKELFGTHILPILPLNAVEADDDFVNLPQGEQRKVVEKQIKQRRGQKKFATSS